MTHATTAHLSDTQGEGQGDFLRHACTKPNLQFPMNDRASDSNDSALFDSSVVCSLLDNDKNGELSQVLEALINSDSDVSNKAKQTVVTALRQHKSSQYLRRYIRRAATVHTRTHTRTKPPRVTLGFCFRKYCCSNLGEEMFVSVFRFVDKQTRKDVRECCKLFRRAVDATCKYHLETVNKQSIKLLTSDLVLPLSLSIAFVIVVGVLILHAVFVYFCCRHVSCL